MQQNLMRIIWLASYQKSGNTWLRAFLANYFAPKGQKLSINQLNRFTTGDVRKDFYDQAAGGVFYGETVEESLRLRGKVQHLIAASKPDHHFVKTHSKIGTFENAPLIAPEVTAGAVYIMRSPFDVVPSFARHSGCSIDEMITRMTNPNAVFGSPDRIYELIGRWDEHIDSWTTAPGLTCHVIRYEDMLADTDAEMRKLLKFLTAPINDSKLKRAIRASSFKELARQEKQQGFGERPAAMDQFFKTGTSGGWRDVLTAEQIGTIRAAFHDTLLKHYPELLEETEFYADAGGEDWI
ncbi:MAG: sulfotransferase domain-containing protein [Pseudomonadota bacterium]